MIRLNKTHGLDVGNVETEEVDSQEVSSQDNDGVSREDDDQAD